MPGTQIEDENGETRPNDAMDRNPYEELRRAVSISVYATHYDRRVSCGEAENIILSAIDTYIEAKTGEIEALMPKNIDPHDDWSAGEEEALTKTLSILRNKN